MIRIVRYFSVLVAALAGFSVTAVAFADDSRELQVQEQPLSDALKSVAEEFGLDIAFFSETTAGLDGPLLAGHYTPQEAFDALLADTNLEYTQLDNGTVVIRTKQAGGDRDSGNGRMGERTQKAVMVAQAEVKERDRNPETDDEDRTIKRLEEITVTGSRIRGAQNASPVITITRQDFDQAGYATVEEFIDKLPQNFSAGASLDQYAAPETTANNIVGGQVFNRAGGTSVNLRGLGASSTLILLNGRRMSPSGSVAGFTNISSIPVTAIERVEVLTDGASAIYGSDAIGGVVNFILRDNYEDAETRLRYGTDARGGTSNILIGQSFGKSWDDGNVLLTYEYYDSDNLANSDRDITATNDLSLFGGTDWRTPGGNPANIVAAGQTFAIPTGQDGTSLTAADFDPNAPLNLYNARSVGDVLPKQQRHSAFLNLTQSVGPVELFADAQFSTQETQFLANVGTFDITVTDTNPFFVDPTGTGLTTVTVENYSFEDDLPPGEVLGEIDSLGAALGMRFGIGQSWNGELVSNWAKEEATRRTTRRINVSIGVLFLCLSCGFRG